MPILIQIIFVLLVLIGTSVDFISRQMFVGLDSEISAFYAANVAAAAYLLYKFIPREPSQPTNSGQSPQRSLGLFATLLNTRDPLLLIRFFAALLVFIQHVNILLRPDPDLLIGAWKVLQGNAHGGMTIFFTLSGFLMGKAFLTQRYDFSRDGVLAYYKSRWIRIFPLMMFVFLMICILQYPEILRFQSSSVLRILLFSYYGNTLGYNGIGDMWSLSVEFQYYIIAPFVFSIFNGLISRCRIRGILLLLATVITSYLGVKLFFHYINVGRTLYDPQYFSLLGNLPFFLTGFLFNYIRVRLPEKLASIFLHDSVLPVLVILIYLCIGHSHKPTPAMWKVSLGAGVVIALLDGMRNQPVLNRRISTIKICEILGVLSYGFYLWHSAVCFAYSRLFPVGFGGHLAYIFEISFVALIVLMMSLATYLTVEERFNFFKPNVRRLTAAESP